MKTSSLLLLLPAVLVSAAADDGSYNDPSRFRKTMLDVHNRYRSEHQVSPLVWDNYVAEASQKHADRCIYEHSNTTYGENIAAGFRTSSAGVEAWGDERDLYSFNGGGYSKATGHFTQMVWKNTWNLGCGAAYCDGILGYGAQWFLVCRYWEPGNVMGEFSQNV
ncbi:CAP domain-containing protein, partial [Trichophaea hybrida]